MLWLPSVDGHDGHHDGDWPIGIEGQMTGGWRKCSCCTRSQVARRAVTPQPRERSAERVGRRMLGLHPPRPEINDLQVTSDRPQLNILICH